MSIRQLTIFISILGILSVLSWVVLFFIPKTQITEGNLFEVSHQAAVLEQKLQELLASNQNNKLKAFQKTLRSFVQLPLPNREGGKDNPFLPVTEQADQFSRPSTSATSRINPVNPSRK